MVEGKLCGFVPQMKIHIFVLKTLEQQDQQYFNNIQLV